MARAALVQTAQVMAVDEVTAEVVTAFGREGITPILLKGPSIARWLYPEGTRAYGDADLLVDPAQFTRASAVLRDLGFGNPSRAMAEHAHTYRRANGSGRPDCVDLHRTIPYITAAPALLWQVFSQDTESMRVARTDVAVLGIPQRLLHMALHAVQHALESTSPHEDLRRAIASAEPAHWRRAVDISRELGAEDALAAGLCLIAEGTPLAQELELTAERRGVLKMAASAETEDAAYQLQRVLDAESWRERVKLVFNPLFVSPSMLREDSAIARRGRVGLALAYAARPFVLAARIGPALATRRRILKPHD